MQTKYNTGQAVLIPATIKSAEQINGQIFYRVDADIWNVIPEENITLNEKAESMRANYAFIDSLLGREEMR